MTELPTIEPRVIAAIPTLYAGVMFRSRLEAKWAAFFDLLKWRWEYEPTDLDGYIPDFVLLFPAGNLLLEVKHELDAAALMAHADKIRRSGWKRDFLIVGGRLLAPESHGNVASLGVYGQYVSMPDGDGWTDLSHAIVHRCDCCGFTSFHHADGDWRCAVCGVHDGNSHVVMLEEKEVQAVWREAANRVQWKPRDGF